METKRYELRRLSSKDIFPMAKIISKIGVKEFSGAFSGADVSSGNASAIGLSVFFDIAGIVFENLNSCEKEIYSFLSDLSGISVKDLQALSMAEFAQMIIDLVQKEEFKDFFKVVSKLLNSEK